MCVHFWVSNNRTTKKNQRIWFFAAFKLQSKIHIKWFMKYPNGYVIVQKTLETSFLRHLENNQFCTLIEKGQGKLKKSTFFPYHYWGHLCSAIHHSFAGLWKLIIFEQYIVKVYAKGLEIKIFFSPLFPFLLCFLKVITYNAKKSSIFGYFYFYGFNQDACKFCMQRIEKYLTVFSPKIHTQILGGYEQFLVIRRSCRIVGVLTL